MSGKTQLGLATVMVMTGSHAFAQVTAPPPDAPAANATDAAPAPGANSFTAAQAKERIEKSGFADVRDLKKDGQGVWRGVASKDGGKMKVALDYKGQVSATQP